MAANEILAAVTTDTGTNLLTQAEYDADAQRPIGNQPGVARSKLVNKMLRQSSLVAAAVAQFIADHQATDVEDTLSPAALTAMFEAALLDTLPGSNSSVIQPIDASVAANALTLEHDGGTTIDYRNLNLNNGAVSTITGAATSLVVPSGATLGSIAATPFRVWLAKVLDGGVEYLAVMNTQIVTGSDITLASVNEANLISTTAIDAAADNAGVWYSAAAHANCPFRLVGYVELTEAVAGTYDTAPNVIQGMYAGLPKPGSVLQYVPAAPYTTYSASSAGVPYDDTVPTSAQGILLHSVSVTPQSGVNILRSRLDGPFATKNSGQACTVSMFSGDTIKQVTSEYYYDSSGRGPVSFSNSHQALTTAARTLTTRFGPSNTTVYVNGAVGGRIHGGASSCTFYVEEIQS